MTPDRALILMYFSLIKKLNYWSKCAQSIVGVAKKKVQRLGGNGKVAKLEKKFPSDFSSVITQRTTTGGTWSSLKN